MATTPKPQSTADKLKQLVSDYRMLAEDVASRSLQLASAEEAVTRATQAMEKAADARNQKWKELDAFVTHVGERLDVFESTRVTPSAEARARARTEAERQRAEHQSKQR